MTARKDLSIAFIGCVAEGKRSLEALLEMEERVCAVFTLTPERAAKVSGAVAWEDLTRQHNVPLHYVHNINDPEPTEQMRRLRPDIVFCVGWTQLLRKPILGIPSIGCIGFHASLLPRYRGRAPVNWAIINGERETGNTMMFLDEGVDTGDIVAQRRFPIEEYDTCATIYDKVAESEVDMLREIMPLMQQGHVPRTPQNDAEASVMPKRRPEDGRIHWIRTTRQLHDWIRALTHPYPGAFTTLDGKRVWIWKARPGPDGARSSRSDRQSPGWWRWDGEMGALLAATSDGNLAVERLQVEGEDEIDGRTFAGRLTKEGSMAESGPQRSSS